MEVEGFLKPIVLRSFPERMLQYVRRIHYACQIKSISEEDEVDLMAVKHLVQQGDCAIDVGANIGVYTLFLSRLIGE